MSGRMEELQRMAESRTDRGGAGGGTSEADLTDEFTGGDLGRVDCKHNGGRQNGNSGPRA
jgi:hypothetical protein